MDKVEENKREISHKAYKTMLRNLTLKGILRLIAIAESKGQHYSDDWVKKTAGQNAEAWINKHFEVYEEDTLNEMQRARFKAEFGDLETTGEEIDIENERAKLLEVSQ